MTSQTNSQMESYIEELIAQDYVNICPSCFKAGERKRLCTNMVFHDGNMCCCWFGDKNEISPSEFKKKIKILKTKSAGEIAPYKIRVRVDFRVL